MSNKLIAEFMELPTEKMGVKQEVIYVMDQDDWYTADELNYHLSWDWLMPVVIKCFEVDEQTNDDLNFKLNDALLETNIDSLYKAVIQFIKVNKIEVLISKLKSAYLDGETTQYILEQIGMDYQMYKQLNVKYNNK